MVHSVTLNVTTADVDDGCVHFTEWTRSRFFVAHSGLIPEHPIFFPPAFTGYNL